MPASLVVVVPESPDDGARAEVVRYCDRCRRWGTNGTTHICGQNWSEYLAPVLASAAATGRQS